MIEQYFSSEGESEKKPDGGPEFIAFFDWLIQQRARAEANPPGNNRRESPQG